MSRCAIGRREDAGLPTKKLEIIISNIDSQLVALDRPAALIASILFLSYRMCSDSVGVSQHLRGMVKTLRGEADFVQVPWLSLL